MPSSFYLRSSYWIIYLLLQATHECYCILFLIRKDPITTLIIYIKVMICVCAFSRWLKAFQWFILSSVYRGRKFSFYMRNMKPWKVKITWQETCPMHILLIKERGRGEEERKKGERKIEKKRGEWIHSPGMFKLGVPKAHLAHLFKM